MNKKIENFLNEAVTKNVFPGCCCAIINQNMVDYYCIGNKAIDPNIEENQIDTYYDLASLTKVVGTTPLILRMIQSGVIQYNTEVYKIIPKFKNKDITIFHLLTHNSGLPADLKWNLDVSKERMIEDICDASQQAIPGKKVIYSDLGYILLGYIAEVVSGEKLEDIMRKNITEIVLFSMYPQYSQTTTFSSFQDVAASLQILKFSPKIHTIDRYYNNPLFIESITNSIRLQMLDSDPKDFVLILSAHSIPLSRIKNGDPYQQECEIGRDLLNQSLRTKGLHFKDIVLSYQSKVGPVKWIGPYTNDVIQQHAKNNIII